jgi:hypothetical protein
VTKAPLRTYEDDPAAHLKTEFGFDVLELARQRYAPQSYHDFIGFGVAKDLLERAFEETYSIPLRSIFKDFDHAILSYRYGVHTVIPKATRIAWVLKKNEIQKDVPGTTRRKFLYNLSRASFEKEWGKNYDHPGKAEVVLAFLIRIFPKIGPVKALAFRTPTPDTEKLFMASFNSALDNYKQNLTSVGDDSLNLPNNNFDTGSISPPGTYFMQDGAYARLLQQLSQDQFKAVSRELRSNLLGYFARLASFNHIRDDKKEKIRVNWTKVPQQLELLKAFQPDALRNRAELRQDSAAAEPAAQPSPPSRLSPGAPEGNRSIPVSAGKADWRDNTTMMR